MMILVYQENSKMDIIITEVRKFLSNFLICYFTGFLVIILYNIIPNGIFIDFISNAI